jgi:membrane glycosyltransferase
MLRNTNDWTSTPPLRRGSMTPLPWTGLRNGLLQALRARPVAPLAGAAHQPAWARAAQRRRRALLLLIATVTLLAGGLQLSHLPPASTLWQTSPAQALASWTFVALFSALFAWVCAGFGTALMGFWVLLRGDPMALPVDDSVRRPLPVDVRTAIVMPICNEDVDAVFAGLEATCVSLAATGALRAFDIFVLSDTRDPALRAAELRAWQHLKQTLGDDTTPRVFYRWRRRPGGRKAGNIADFCRRWGRNYRYMVVLDADSVMSGDCLLRMVQVMEAHPQVGIAQTSPEACAPDTLHARAQQFANRVLGRLYVAGLQYWQLGDSHYWGHNAILRVAPFMQHCALAKLPSRDGAGVEILSHDFVEAALMRRAGYEVWMLPGLAGSYEQLPAHLLDELQRDHRWCRGNLRNARLLAEPGLASVHRTLFITGVMAYASAPLWLAYVLLGWLTPAGNSTGGHTANTLLWALTVCLLVLPRALATAAVWLRGEQQQFGGGRRLVLGALLEAVLASLQAPVRMLAHSWSVTTALMGHGAGWQSPPRQALQVPWRDAMSQFSGWCAAIGLGLCLAAWSNPNAGMRLLFLAGPLMLAVPLVVWTSRVDWGSALRGHGLLRVPLEAQVPGPLRPALVAPAVSAYLSQWLSGPVPVRRHWAPRAAAALWLVFALLQPPANQPRFSLELAEFDTTLLAWNELSPLTGRIQVQGKSLRGRPSYPVSSQRGTRLPRAGMARSRSSLAIDE